ncbi:sigma-70 family RNA polymerase sigma factor [Catellatospora sp. KI3]|uniref:sigma-70 family RNA polymerase sigma factor n=1 Tax=Catellatospora sp. KI3 TaxID=3041620 RepID=UPI0024824CD6|nr:sigma-70 family RNA polymerase sigma factor [Catellatospora sp. KI3]MDI1460964.1 sigma-70 family RNA polymerase sigma factor [Catellatospora sp. KI3]
MTTRDLGHSELVIAAQRGDRRARGELLSAYLPLIYNIVGRALGGHADVDDVVQETMLRAARDLPKLRDPDSFRSWLVAITVHQISSHRHRWRRRSALDTTVAGMDQFSDADASFEDTAVLRLHLADQRRHVARAGTWLDPDYRLALSLWWQELAGLLTRGEVADAMGLTIAHAGVRLQRMREQLDTAWAIEVALTDRPRCPQLDAAAVGWDGSHTSVWRKRLGRHVRGCAVCAAGATDRVPLERLLLNVAPLTVPVALGAALTAKGLLAGTAGSAGQAIVGSAAAASAEGARTSVLGKLAAGVAAHPLPSLAAGVALAVGTAAVYANWPSSPEAPGVVAGPSPVLPTRTPASPSPQHSATPGPASPSPQRPTPSPSPAAAPTLPPGTWSLESAGARGTYLTYAGNFATLGAVDGSSTAQARRQATFTVVSGLADANCVTFRAADGRYLRHYELRLRLSPEDATPLFREDATFCPRPGPVAGSVELQSHNYPDLVIRFRDGAFYIDVPDGSAEFDGQSSFIRHPAWAA